MVWNRCTDHSWGLRTECKRAASKQSSVVHLQPTNGKKNGQNSETVLHWPSSAPPPLVQCIWLPYEGQRISTVERAYYLGTAFRIFQAVFCKQNGRRILCMAPFESDMLFSTDQSLVDLTNKGVRLASHISRCRKDSIGRLVQILKYHDHGMN